jgi:hypothetical protein
VCGVGVGVGVVTINNDVPHPLSRCPRRSGRGDTYIDSYIYR